MGSTSSVFPKGTKTIDAVINHDFTTEPERIIAHRTVGLDASDWDGAVYMAYRSSWDEKVVGMVVLYARKRIRYDWREDEVEIYTKVVDEDMGPAEATCPKAILDLLDPTENEYATEWRRQCREYLTKPVPKKGDTVTFDSLISFQDGSTERCFTYLGGNLFHMFGSSWAKVRITGWKQMAYEIEDL
jgi:hypothetical protein